MSTRVLCLGNDLLADDGLGPAVAERLRQLGTSVEIMESAESGFYLFDRLLHCQRLIVVDTIATGTSAPGTVSMRAEAEISAVPGSSPHYAGICEGLELARRSGMPAADQVTFITVEAQDLTTIGAAMTPAVAASLDDAVALTLIACSEPVGAAGSDAAFT